MEPEYKKIMKKKLESWIAKKIKTKPSDVIVKSLKVEYDYINPVTMELTHGIKEIKL